MHGAVSIRPQHPNSRILQSFEQLRTGMPVGVVFSSGYDSNERLYGSEEFRSRRILTSMMSDLQHVGMQLFHAISLHDALPMLTARNIGKAYFRVNIFSAACLCSSRIEATISCKSCS